MAIQDKTLSDLQREKQDIIRKMDKTQDKQQLDELRKQKDNVRKKIEYRMKNLVNNKVQPVETPKTSTHKRTVIKRDKTIKELIQEQLKKHY